MKYICKDCGEIFDEDDFVEELESIGEYHGSRAYQSTYVCPFCGSDECDEYNEDEVVYRLIKLDDVSWDDYYESLEALSSMLCKDVRLKGIDYDWDQRQDEEKIRVFKEKPAKIISEILDSQNIQYEEVE